MRFNMSDIYDTEAFDEDPLESDRQAQWEAEAHYWHTVMAYVDLIEQHGYDKVLADVSYTIDRREADKASRTRHLEDIIPCPDLSFLTSRPKVGEKYV
jgi:hypothetical protein